MPGISLSKPMSCVACCWCSFPGVSLRFQAATTESLPLLLLALARAREVNIKLPPPPTSASYNHMHAAHVRPAVLSI
jgi:hypothetical protein